VPFEEELGIFNTCSLFMTVPSMNILRIPTLRHSSGHGVRKWNGQCNGSSINVLKFHVILKIYYKILSTSQKGTLQGSKIKKTSICLLFQKNEPKKNVS
jgi:hypothetical protein